MGPSTLRADCAVYLNITFKTKCRTLPTIQEMQANDIGYQLSAKIEEKQQNKIRRARIFDEL